MSANYTTEKCSKSISREKSISLGTIVVNEKITKFSVDSKKSLDAFEKYTLIVSDIENTRTNVLTITILPLDGPAMPLVIFP